MTVVGFAALVYAVLAGVATLFQFAIALGVPWGRFTLGGRHPGRVSVRYRVAAVAQGGVLVLLAMVVAAHADLLPGHQWPGWMVWVVAAVAAVSAALNTITPSRPERLLWAPITWLMLAATVVVALGA